VTKIIDKLFPEFVRAENGKLVGVIKNLRPEVQNIYAGLLADFNVPAETVARTISDGTGAKILPETVQFYRNKLKNIPIEIPNVGTIGVSSRTSGRASDEFINMPTWNEPVTITPEIQNIARNAGIDVNGLLNSVQKESTTSSRVNEATAYMAEESAKLDLANKAEALRLQKQINDLSVMNKQIDVKSNSLNNEVKELEIKQKKNTITHQEEMSLIEKKRELNKLASDRIDNFKKMKFIFITLAVITFGITLINKRCDWFPWACDFFSGKGGSKSKGGGKKDINDY
jgi:hypothetical protein